MTAPRNRARADEPSGSQNQQVILDDPVHLGIMRPTMDNTLHPSQMLAGDTAANFPSELQDKHLTSLRSLSMVDREILRQGFLTFGTNTW